MSLGGKKTFKEELENSWTWLKCLLTSHILIIILKTTVVKLETQKSELQLITREFSFKNKTRLKIQTCMQDWWLATLHISLIMHIYWTADFCILSRRRLCLHWHNTSRHLWVPSKIEFASSLLLVEFIISQYNHWEKYKFSCLIKLWPSPNAYDAWAIC